MTPTLFLSGDAWQLLANAEAHVYETECSNHCAKFEKGVMPSQHGCFKASKDGYLVCDAYELSAVVA